MSSKIVSYEEVEIARMGNKCYIIDVRSHKDRLKTGEIPNTISIPLPRVAHFFTNFPDRFDKNGEFIFIFERSSEAVATVNQLGINNAKYCECSWIEWKKQMFKEMKNREL